MYPLPGPGPFNDDPRFNDRLAPSPVDYEEIELGPGQEPNAFSHLQHTNEGSAIMGTDVRREPGYEHLVVVSTWPESPA